MEKCIVIDAYVALFKRLQNVHSCCTIDLSLTCIQVYLTMFMLFYFTVTLFLVTIRLESRFNI